MVRGHRRDHIIGISECSLAISDVIVTLRPNKTAWICVIQIMKPWESLIDQKIREAMEQGEFDDLPGKGRPIDTSEHPFEDPEMRLAHRMLRNAGFAPSWIEERKDIDSEVESARRELTRVWTVRQNALGTEHEDAARARWEKALAAFHVHSNELNRRIVAWNLKVPAVGFQRRLIDAEKEIEEVER